VKKSLMFFVAIIVLVTTVLSACGSNNEKNAESGNSAAAPTSSSGSSATAPSGKITVFVFGNADEKRIREEQTKLFSEKFPDIKVDLQVSPDFDRKLEAMLASDTGPDVFMLSSDWHGIRGRQGYLEDLNPYIERDKLDTSNLIFDRFLQDFVLPDGLREGMPVNGATFLMAYNKDMFDAASVATPTSDWTWDDTLAAAQKMTTGEGVNQIFGLADHWSYRDTAPYMFGGGYFTPDYQTVMTDDPKSVKGVEFVMDLINKYKVMPDANAAKGLPSDQRFFGGKAAMIPIGVWDIANFQRSINGSFNWDTVSMPKDSASGKPTTWALTMGLGLYAKSKNKDAAWEYIKFMSTDVAAQNLITEVGIPAIKDVANNVFAKLETTPTTIQLQPFVDALDQAILATSIGGYFLKLRDEKDRMWDQITINGMSPADAMKAYSETAKKIMETL
jgi:multiple sugar transport system substrate-binding protein